MDSNTFSWSRFEETPLIAILRGHTETEILAFISMCSEVGIDTIEVTMNTPQVLEIIKKARVHYPNLNIGAGTVCNDKDLELALEAGAQFIVTPILAESVIESAVEKGIPVFPGAFSPSEVYRAWLLGASAVKLFPAGPMGPRYIRDILGPLDQIKLIPTGGISINNLHAYLAAGAYGVGMGGSLFPKEYLNGRDDDQMKMHLSKIKTILSSLVATRADQKQ